MYKISFFLLFCFSISLGSLINNPIPAALNTDLQAELDRITSDYVVPGITLSVRIDPDNEINLSSGYATKGQVKMKPADRMLGGSTGKMYVSTIALQLMEDGLFELDDKIEVYIGEKEWFVDLPNARQITIRDLMQHTTGLPRYILQPEFLESLKNDLVADRTPENCIAYVLGKDPQFAPGKGFAYSDTNYLLLGMIIEKITGEKYNELLISFLEKYGLKNTAPSDSRKLEGLVQGYIGNQNFFNLPKEMVKDGELVMNPAFEWTGGGTITNVSDLTRLAYLIHAERLIDSSTYNLFTSPVSQRSGQPYFDGYGLGTFVWSQGGDLVYGHSGFFPGYQTHVEYSTDHEYAIAIQVNTDDGTANVKSLTNRLAAVVEKYMDDIDREKIIANFQKQEECWNDHDIECYMEAYAPDGLIQTASRGGITYGYEDIIESYRRGFPEGNMGQLFFDNITQRKLNSQFYHVTGRFNLKFDDREALFQGWFSATMEKIKGDWYMITDHSS